jgi:hypothetical protein
MARHAETLLDEHDAQHARIIVAHRASHRASPMRFRLTVCLQMHHE